MRPQISYIIPSHNGEKYLSACVESILCQKNIPFEIIIVENGSSDNTFELALSLSQKDSRIRVFRSEKGVSNARNVGIEMSRGGYLCFVDQDDLLLPDADLVFARGFSQFAGCDVYLACSDSQTENSEEYWHLVPKGSMKKLLIHSLKNPTKTLTAWAKLFSADLIKTNLLFFDPKLSHSEDSDFVISVLLNSSFAAKIDRAVYHYAVNENSAVHKTGSNLSDKYALAMLKTSRRLSKAPKEVKDAFLLYVLDHLLVVFVNDVFKNGSLKEQYKRAKCLLKEGVFADALKDAPIFKTSPSKAILFLFAKVKIVTPICLASKLRQMLKRKKK